MTTSSGADRSVGQRSLVWLVWVLCGLVVALVASALLLQALGPRPVGVPVLVQDALLVALAIPFVIVGALISAHRPGNRVGALLLAGALALSVFSFLENYFGYVVQRPGVLPDLRAVAWIANGALAAGWGALVLMVLVYPTGRLASRRWRPVAWALAAWTLAAAALLTVQPTLVMTEDVPNPIGLRGSAATVVKQALDVAILPSLFLLPAAMASLVVRFRRARGLERQQLKWLLYAFALSATATILAILGVLGAWGGAIDNLVAWGIPIAIGDRAFALPAVRHRPADQPDPGLRVAHRHPGPRLCRCRARPWPSVRRGGKGSAELGGGRRHPGRGRPVPASPPPHPGGRGSTLQPMQI
jgi:hypothetical protein